MNMPSKVPPRFVPTLTEVVQPDELAAEPGQPPVAQVVEPAEVAPLASFHSPWRVGGLHVRSQPASIPQDLPPLPESLPPQQPFAPSAAPDAPKPVVAEAVEPRVMEELLAHRLMQRVDAVLEQRLQEAIARVVEEQTRSMALRLREEVESTVRQSVAEAVESELAQMASAARAMG